MTTSWKGWITFGIVSIMLLVVLPVLTVLPSDSMFNLPDFYLTLLGKYLSLAVMALGLGLLWGYAGVLSLGQADTHSHGRMLCRRENFF